MNILIFLSCFFFSLPNSYQLTHYPLTRHEYLPKGTQYKPSIIMKCTKDFDHEICYPKNLQYRLISSIKISISPTLTPLNLAIDLTTNISWLISPAFFNEIKERNCPKNQICSSQSNFSCSYGNFSGFPLQTSLNLIQTETSITQIDKFDLFIGLFGKQPRFFKADGVLALNTNSKVIESLKKKSFGFILHDNNEGESIYELIKGEEEEIQNLYNETKLIWIKLRDYKHYWVVNLNSFAISFTNHSKHPTKIIDFIPKKAILTLSSSLIGLPQKDLIQLLNFMNGNESNASCKANPYNFNIIECQTMRFPFHFEHLKVILEFEKSDNVFYLDWQFLIKKCIFNEQTNQYQCRLNLYQSVSNWIVLGEPFFKDHISIFNHKDKKFGFAKIKPQLWKINETSKSIEIVTQATNYKNYAIILIFLGVLLMIIITVIIFKKNFVFLSLGKESFKKTRKKENLTVMTNSFSKDDNDVKTSVLEFENDLSKDTTKG